MPQSRQLRTLHELVKSLLARQTDPDGLDLRGKTLAIGTFELFLKHANKAKNIYVLKNVMSFQAGVSSLVRQQVRDLIAFNSSVKLCYGFTRDSEAAMTFLNFRSELARKWPRNIFWKEFDPQGDFAKLMGAVFASPFIIEDSDGRIGILLECPVKVLKSASELDTSTSASVFLEIADTQKYQMWMRWRKHLESVAWESAPVIIKSVKEWNESFGEQRDAAFDLDLALADGFDNVSTFVVATIEGEAVGSLRLTDSEKASPIREWNKSKKSLPLGKGVVELTRGAVLANMRKLGIFRSMIFKALRDSEEAGFLHAAIVVAPIFSIVAQLHKFGFNAVGHTSTFHRIPDEEAVCQLFVCNLKDARPLWDKVSREIEEEAEKKNVSIKFG